MHSHGRIVAAVRRGRTEFSELRSSPPITLRRIGPNAVAIVSSAAWPVGGDTFRLDVEVGAGAAVTVTSVAASMAHPSPGDARSTFEVVADVADGADLRWLPEPTVLVAGCDHATSSSVRLAATASLSWREEVRLGRWNEPSGSLNQRTSIERAGRPLLRNEIDLGPAWVGSASPAAIDPRHVAIGTAVRVGSASAAAEAQTGPELSWAAHPLDCDATSWTVLSTRMSTMRSTLAALSSADRASEPGRLAH